MTNKAAQNTAQNGKTPTPAQVPTQNVKQKAEFKKKIQPYT